MTQPSISDARLLSTLRWTFGHDSFRPLQEDIVRAVLARQDVFVLMPTGAGKSLCYQLPALLTDGLTVVVSPLIALMKDQVDALEARGVPAAYLNSSLSAREVAERRVRLMRGELKLLYVAPERLMMESFLRLLETVRPAFFAIDEVHCVSEWGHDFRPEYRALTKLRRLFPQTPVGAFTATATARVEEDVVAQLGLGRARRFRGSFNRPNLVYAVEPKRDGDRQLLELLARHREDTGIVYCMARVETERVAALIHQHGFAAAPYHAGMSSEGRGQRQEAFACGQLRVIVATIAFGMGIDKADVRFVVHYDAPRSLEGYYQESGRAGRDGALSECLLLYSAGDVGRMEYFVAQKPAAEQSVAREQLRKVRDYAEGQVCRRRFLLAYFDETLEQAPSPCCDLCRHPAQIEDYTMPAQMLMSCAMRTGQRFGSAHLIAVLRGARSERLLRLGHDKLSTYGIGRDRSEDEWRHIARQLEIGGYLKRDAEGNGLVVTETGSAVLFRGQQVLLPALPGSRSRRGNRSSDQAAEGVKAGGTIAAGRTDAQEDAKEVVLDAPAARKVTPTIERTIALFNGRRTLDQVALDRGLALATIEDHLATAVEAGRIEIEALVPAERRAAIGAALAVVGADLLRPVFDHLKGEYSFGEIKLVRAALRRSTLRSLQD